MKLHSEQVRIIILILAIIALISPIALQRSSGASTTSRQVTVDVYVINIGDVNQQAGSYNIDMYLSFSWSGNWSASGNNASEPAFPSHFDLANGEINSMTLIDAEQNVSGTGYNYLEYRIQAIVYSPFNFQRYPLDKQRIFVNIEDSYYGNDSLVYVSDSHSMIDSSVHVPGWIIQSGSVQLSVSTHVYNSTFGYPGASQGTQYAYSQATFSFSMARPETTSVLDLGLPMVVLVGLSMISFRIKIEAFDSRLMVGVLNIFAAVAFLISIDSSLPAGFFTLADEFMVVAFAVSMYSIGLTVWFHRFDPERLPSFVNRLDKASFMCMPIVALVILGLIVLF